MHAFDILAANEDSLGLAVSGARIAVADSGNGVPAYVWTTSPRLRKRKP